MNWKEGREGVWQVAGICQLGKSGFSVEGFAMQRGHGLQLGVADASRVNHRVQWFTKLECW